MIFKIPKIKKKSYITRINVLKKSILKTEIFYGHYGLKALEGGYITFNQLESARRVFAKLIKKNSGQLWLKVYPNLAKSKKPNEMRMGKGKGPIKSWYFKVCAGVVVFEISGFSYIVAKKLLNIARTKLPLRTVFVVR